ncbi:MAG TPA: hypothetical protein VFY18_02885 [Candidatus Limnocylindrales bacterium]|nr:hypothetical protein [Candidatus Limnocylindrales bacterium]
MPAPFSRLRRLLHGRSGRSRRALIPALLVLAAAAAIGAGPVGARTAYSRDMYFTAGYERQIDNRTCTAASTAMMMNFIARRDLNLSQSAILAYEQPRDALNNSVQRGSDPLGWARAATYFSRYTGHPTSYAWETYPTEAKALARAGLQMTLTGRPVGLVVQNGKHAVVMTGFTSSRNPLDPWFNVSTVAISDPYGSHHYWVGAPYSPLSPYYEMDATTTYDRLWYGKYIIIAPQV